MSKSNGSWTFLSELPMKMTIFGNGNKIVHSVIRFKFPEVSKPSMLTWQA